MGIEYRHMEEIEGIADLIDKIREISLNYSTADNEKVNEISDDICLLLGRIRLTELVESPEGQEYLLKRMSDEVEGLQKETTRIGYRLYGSFSWKENTDNRCRPILWDFITSNEFHEIPDKEWIEKIRCPIEINLEDIESIEVSVYNLYSDMCVDYLCKLELEPDKNRPYWKISGGYKVVDCRLIREPAVPTFLE